MILSEIKNIKGIILFDSYIVLPLLFIFDIFIL